MLLRFASQGRHRSGALGVFCIRATSKVSKKHHQEDHKHGRQHACHSSQVYACNRIAFVNVEDSSIVGKTAGNAEICDADRMTEQELCNLHRGEKLLPLWGVAEASQGVIGIHNGVDEGVEGDKDPRAEQLAGS